MTPVGHTSVSYLGARWSRLPLWPFLAGGVAPDIDFLLLPLASFNGWHRVLTHNVFFVAIVALVCSALSSSKRATFAAALVGGALHLLVDSMLDSNPTNGIGVAVLWPLSSQPYSLVNLASAQCAIGWSDAISMVGCALPLLLWELPIWGVAGVLLLRDARRLGQKKKVA